ncbi:MAG TPA: dihydropteroate synthase [Actinomycetota bacterium]|nr:dihydropteroate synthase [Actinomycetota bacterium]
MTVATTILRGRDVEVSIGDDAPFVMIGERINPTGRARLTAEMTAGDMTTVRADAVAQVEAGARVLDVNAGVPGFDEAEMLANVVRAVGEVVAVPLCIDSSTPEVLEAVLPVVPGKPVVNSVTAEDASLQRLLPLVARHGAAVIGMANDEEGISMDPAVRLAAARKIVEAAERAGIAREDVIVDPLCMPVGAEPRAATAMVETIVAIRDELGVNVSCGASNISFGLPDRDRIDATFLALMIGAGMNAAITNPLHESIATAVRAADVLLTRDAHAAAWIAAHRAAHASASASPPPSSPSAMSTAARP